MSNNLGWTPIAENDPIGHEVANDNFDLFDEAISGAQGYDFDFAFTALPDPSTIVGKRVLVRDILVPANFFGSVGSLETSPDQDYPIDVTVDNVSIGTIIITSYATFIFETVGGTEKTIAANSVVRFISPPASPAETSLTGVSVTIKAALSL